MNSTHPALFRLGSRLAFVLLALLCSSPSHASFSCAVGAGPTVSGGRTRFSDWLASSSASGLNGTTAVSPLDADTVGGTLTFDIASVLGHTFRLQGNVGGNAHFTGANAPSSSISADASNTLLFNLILPDGCSLVPLPAESQLLAAPQLQSVPIPASLWLLGSGLLGLAGAALRSAG